MERFTFDEGMRRIEASGIRHFKPAHFDVIFKDIEFIDDRQFKTMVDDFIELEYQPKSITGWFRKRGKDSRQASYNQFLDDSYGIPAGEYTAKDMKWFFKCVYRAMKVSKAKKMVYGDWVELFNKKWEELSGEALTQWLEAQYQGLVNS